MSWTDDIRCLYCDGRLPLYKKITDGQFCSAAHRKAYWQEHERLAVERLLQTHDSLRAYRPPGAVEAILGPSAVQSEFDVPELLQCISLQLAPKVETLPEILAADPLVYDTDLEVQCPLWTPEIEAAGHLATANVFSLPPPNCPQWLADHLATPEPEPVSPAGEPVWPASAGLGGGAVSQMETLFPARFGPVDWTQLAGAGAMPIDARVRPMYAVKSEVPPPAKEAERLLDEQVPSADKLQPIPRPTALESLRSHTEAADQPAPTAFFPAPKLPSDAWLPSNALPQAGLRQLPMDLTPPAQEGLRALEAPEFPPLTPVRRPRLSLAARKRYPVRTRESAAATSASPQERKVKVMAAAASPGPRQTPNVPSPSGLLPLTPAAGSAKSGSALPASSHLPPMLPQPLRTEPMRPMSKLEPFDAKPAADLVATPLPVRSLAAMPAGPAHKAHVWTHGVDFWKHAPRDLKTLVFAIPVLLGLALHPTLPKVRVTAPSTGGIQRGFQRAVHEQYSNVRQTLVDRAAVALDDDFRSGLDEWASRGDATTEWSFDATGFVRPGPLALYKPSVGLSDYQMQFLGLIDKKALSWVVRAADFDNYYVVKLVVLKPGPVPTIGLIRYAVVNGRPDSRMDTAVPVDARMDMLYRVRLDVRGETFVLAVQGQMVDTWSEPRLRHGGVGFFTARDEASRVRWLQVTHQYDMLGRLCAYLAPYNISSTNGGWQQ